MTAPLVLEPCPDCGRRLGVTDAGTVPWHVATGTAIKPGRLPLCPGSHVKIDSGGGEGAA